MITRLGVPGFVLLSLLALSSCRSDAGPEGVITLRVVNWATDLELSSEQRIADRFAGQRSHVRVIVESIATNYGEKLATSIASGVPPDVFLLDVPDIPTFVERGLVLDLTPYVSRVVYDPESVFPQVRAVFERGGQLFAFPKGFTPLVIFYNRKLFRELNVPAPPEDGWTWEEFLDISKRVTQDREGDGRINLFAVGFPRQLYEWIPWVWSGGGDILDPEGRRTVGYLDSRATVETFEFLTSWVTKHRIAPPVQYLRAGDPMRVGRFYMGKQAMLISGHWHLPRLASYAERGDVEIGVAPIPHRLGAEPTTVVYTSGWAVPANVRHKRLAVELANYLAGADAQRMRARSRLEIPALVSVASEVADSDPSGVEKAFLRQVENARVPWGATVLDFHEIEEMSFDIMDRHLLNGDSLQVAASEIARAIDRVIAR